MVLVNVLLLQRKRRKTKVTATCNGKKYICNIIVKKAKVKLDSKVKLKVSKTKTIKLKNNTQKVSWRTSDSKIVKLVSKKNNGVKIKGLKNGTAKVYATIGKKTYVSNVTVGKPYTYKVTPMLPPFNEYFYIETDNPDPESFRLVDRKSVNAGSDEPTVDPVYGSITPDDKRYIDVKYEDEKTGRVKGAILRQENIPMAESYMCRRLRKLMMVSGVERSILINSKR